MISFIKHGKLNPERIKPREKGAVNCCNSQVKNDYAIQLKSLYRNSITPDGLRRRTPNENSYTTQMVRTIKYFSELG